MLPPNGTEPLNVADDPVTFEAPDAVADKVELTVIVAVSVSGE